MPKSLWIPLGLLGLAACNLTPVYERPVSPVRSAFAESRADASALTIDTLPWRTVFQDAHLAACIERALANNRDLRVALLNVEAARAQYQIQRASLYPELEAGASFTRTQTSGELEFASGAGATSTTLGAQVGLTAYELDFFGRVRSANEQALQVYGALEESARAVQIALVAQVAAQYLTLREAQQQLALAEQTLASIQEARALTQSKVDAGAAPASELSSIEVQIQTARVQLPLFERVSLQARNTLEELVGEPLPEPPASLGADAVPFDEALLAELPPGLPSDLLARRPDVRAAEHQLRAANANIGSAKAAFFPTIALTTTAGLASADLSDLFQSSAQTWSFAPRITLPIFDGGRNEAGLELAEVQREIQVATYEKAVQTAFREVADALAARRTYLAQRAAQAALVEAQRERLEFATLRYQGGAGNYLEVLTAQQALFSAQTTQISVRSMELQNLITLYKVLGGGWDPSVTAPNPEPTHD